MATISELRTPAVLIDVDVAKRNADRMVTPRTTFPTYRTQNSRRLQLERASALTRHL